MKRIKAACLQQTIHFQLKEGLERDEAVRAVQEEYQRYKAQLDRNRTTYRILSESLTDKVIEYNKVQKWNGELPQVTGSSGSFVNIN